MVVVVGIERERTSPTTTEFSKQMPRKKRDGFQRYKQDYHGEKGRGIIKGQAGRPVLSNRLAKGKSQVA